MVLVWLLSLQGGKKGRIRGFLERMKTSLWHQLVNATSCKGDLSLANKIGCRRQDKDEVREVLIEDGDLIAEEIQDNAQNKMPRKSLAPKQSINRNRKAYKMPRKSLALKQSINRNRKASKETIHKETVASENIQPFTQIAIRFPNGERKEQRFHSTDTIWSIYMFIDSLEIPCIGAYQLISNFPRKVFGYEQLKMTLRDAGLHPNAALFLELLH